MAHLKYFTNRESQIVAFDSLWQSDSPWVIVFSGLSGNGKSTLTSEPKPAATRRPPAMPFTTPVF